jgi:hypothetical protein
VLASPVDLDTEFFEFWCSPKLPGKSENDEDEFRFNGDIDMALGLSSLLADFV